jgi:hypothetical protein
MRSLPPAEQRKRIASFLMHQRTGVISTIAAGSTWAMPIWYRPHRGPSGNSKLEVDCLVPRWADVAYHLTEGARVILIVQASSEAGLRWLQIQGKIQPIEAPDWASLLPRWVPPAHPDALYLVVRITPGRIDLIDEAQGWGVQTTLEW